MQELREWLFWYGDASSADLWTSLGGHDDIDFVLGEFFRYVAKVGNHLLAWAAKPTM
jgi:hypothetical protein